MTIDLVQLRRLTDVAQASAELTQCQLSGSDIPAARRQFKDARLAAQMAGCDELQILEIALQADREVKSRHAAAAEGSQA